MLGALLVGCFAVQSSSVAAADAPGIVISEVHPGGSGNGTYAADWIELTNTGTTPIDVSGWRIDDSSNLFSASVALTGAGVLEPGESAIFVESSSPAVTVAAFRSAWFGGSAPADLLIGSYTGSGIGLSTSGDDVHVFDGDGNHITGVSLGAATANATFDNASGAGSATAPFPPLSTVSTIGFNGAFLSANGAETGSPGVRLLSSPLTGVDLSRYVRVGRFNLPDPSTVTPPAGSALAREASAVTYNWDTETLFIAGDTSTSIVQVTKTGELIRLDDAGGRQQPSGHRLLRHRGAHLRRRRPVRDERGARSSRDSPGAESEPQWEWQRPGLHDHG